MNPYDYLKSEEQEVQRILDHIPEDRWIERASFQGRLETIQTELEGMEPTKSKRIASLTFRGEPVRGSEAISADFASKVTNFFNDAVTSIAASHNDRLGHKGRIPDKQGKQLYITGMAIGSFGFEFELPDDTKDESVKGDASTADALSTLVELFKAGENGDDEELAEIVDEVHPRAAAKVHEMLEFMLREKAYCSLVFGDDEFRFSSLSSLKKATANLKSDRIEKGAKDFEGEFKGSLPDYREFEFKPNDQSNSWKGRIGAEIEDPDTLYPYLRKQVKVSLQFTRVGHARPRYTLESIAAITELPEEAR